MRIDIALNGLQTKELTFSYQVFAEEEDNSMQMKKMTALDHVDLFIEEGSFVAILGHNGSGKSTLSKQFNALLAPDSGDVWVYGNNTKEEGQLWKIRQSVGMIFQNPDNQIIGNLVEEDVAFGAENLGLPTEEIISRTRESLAAVNMSEYATHSPNRLSGGQKQRVAIAGILAMRPRCIIFDESTAMLDPMGRKEVLEIIKELNQKEKITVIMITHYMEEALEAGHILVMDKGKIVLEGKPEEIFAQQDYLYEIGLHVPQSVELADELRKRGMDIPLSVLNLEDLLKEIPSL
ncbi:energy-coupling factor transporter ATP-binding protein EcfA [Clostridia bacterium]|nr:energy-coupling factor transporter ATP-binding protein EcfA [Clostridia bacterium]